MALRQRLAASRSPRRRLPAGRHLRPVPPHRREPRADGLRIGRSRYRPSRYVPSRSQPRRARSWNASIRVPALLGRARHLVRPLHDDAHREPAATTQEVLRGLHENGLLEARTTLQRSIQSRCASSLTATSRGPVRAAVPTARGGDQCDACGATLDPIDLIDPRSKLTGATPEQRETEHFFFLLPKLEERMLAWLESRQGWRRTSSTGRSGSCARASMTRYHSRHRLGRRAAR